MRMRILLSTAIVVVVGTSTLLAHRHLGSTRAHLHGTSIFHRYLRATLEYVATEETERPPYGWAMIKHNAQGRANNQRLTLVARRLDRNTTYHLLARFEEITEENPDPVYVEIGTVQSRPNGTLVLHQKKIGSSQGLGAGHENFQLATLFDPVDAILELALARPPEPEADPEWDIVLRANFEAPRRLHYLIKRQLANPEDDVAPEAEGVIFLRANHRWAWFQLRLAGLEPGTEYFLVLNDKTDEKTSLWINDQGLLECRTDLASSGDVLALKSLEIWDDEDQVVLRTTFPLP